MKILVECFPDEALLRVLGVPRKRLLHERSKGRILTRLRGLPGAVGMVDEDPGSPQHRDLNTYNQIRTGEGLHLLVREGSGSQRLIVLRPRIEEWLIQRAKSMRVAPEDSGLSSNPDRLHSIPHYENRPGFHRFVEKLAALDARGVGLLQRWTWKEEAP